MPVGLYILFGFLALLLLLLLCPIGYGLRYSEAGFEQWLVFLFFRISIKQSGKAKPKEAKPGRKRKETAEKAKRPGAFENFSAISDKLLDYLRAYIESIRISRLEIAFIAASGNDPAAAAITYGKAWTVYGMLAPILNSQNVTKKRRIDISIDYSRKSSVIYFAAEARIMIFKLLRASFKPLFAILKLIRNNRTERKDVEYGKTDS